MENPNLNTIIPSIIRTAVPAAWGALIALGIKQFPAIGEIADETTALGQLITWVTIALWYAFSRWLEPRTPAAIRAILFGTTAQPAAYSKEPEQVAETLRRAA